jgi:hypothetical protein
LVGDVVADGGGNYEVEGVDEGGSEFGDDVGFFVDG